jgi:hypothetical protein
MARIGWAVMIRQQNFRRRLLPDQLCPDLASPGAVLPAVKTALRTPAAVACGQS